MDEIDDQLRDTMVRIFTFPTELDRPGFHRQPHRPGARMRAGQNVPDMVDELEDDRGHTRESLPR
ncbi:MAG: hypothetical protein ISP32_06725 [Thermoleophilia bacterium]|nr:hypothetical protein [Thermoleophilia bacterium]